jgi:Tfp pilus assembly PilM family ATPase
MSSWLASPPPDAAVEISSERVTAAVLSGRSVVGAYAAWPLPEGAVTPSLTVQNINDRSSVASALRTVLSELGTRPRRVALILPDVAAKVSIVRFEQVPARRDDLDQLVRWQVRKSAPFAVDDACVTYTAGQRGAEGAEFVVALARRDVVTEYEAICREAGVYAGLVDLSTFCVLNLFLAASDVPAGDWLTVHMRPEYTSIVITRGEDVIFFRNRPEGEGDTLADLVHQTAMYYEDRLTGTGFSRVLLGGGGRVSGGVDAARASLEQRLGVAVEPIDITRIAKVSNRVPADRDLQVNLAPLVGMMLRAQKEAVTA